MRVTLTSPWSCGQLGTFKLLRCKVHPSAITSIDTVQYRFDTTHLHKHQNSSHTFNPKACTQRHYSMFPSSTYEACNATSAETTQATTTHTEKNNNTAGSGGREQGWEHGQRAARPPHRPELRRARGAACSRRAGCRIPLGILPRGAPPYGAR